MKKKLYGFIALLLICCLCLCSCSSDANIMDEEYDDSIEDYVSEDIEETQEEEPSGITMEEAKQIGGIWIKKGEEYFAINGYELNYRAASIYAYDHIGFSRLDFQEIPNLNISEGDILVTFTSMDYCNFELVDAWRYCFPADVSSNGGSGLYYNSAGMGHLNGEKVEESYSYEFLTDKLEGYDLTGSNYNNNIHVALAEKNAYLLEYSNDNSVTPGTIICADEPTSLEYEYYEGTDYCSGTIDIDTNIFTLENKITEPVTKTKEGYFIVETDSLIEGFNVIDIGQNWPQKYVIRVVK